MRGCQYARCKGRQLLSLELKAGKSLTVSYSLISNISREIKGICYKLISWVFKY